ncbi:DUF397 domain-containing protein, partial [Nocardia elegans]|uniref:DUF397 domain-containing protein n=1 Tax=Nocardia elegans TaxID=300029 RepID=UPI001895B118
KSTFSQGGGECVEIAHLDNGGVGVRLSKTPSGPVLTFTPAEWDAFLAGVRDGQFDRP